MSRLRAADLDYELPAGLIATEPARPRDSARLLVVSRSDPGVLMHRHVRDLPDFFRPGDALIVNTSKVLPARLLGVRADTGGAVEALFLGPALSSPTDTRSAAHPDLALPPWRLMFKGRRMRPGVLIRLRDPRSGVLQEVGLRLLGRAGEPGEEGAWIASPTTDVSAGELLSRLGLPPLPPYIRSARKADRAAHEPAAPERADEPGYQTVYASPTHAGSIAAPTAGLHFTPELLDRLEGMGVRRGEVILHVGAGTFKPVECEFVEDHPMHAEWCEVPAATTTLLASARARRGGAAGAPRIVAVGTTSARTLESFAGSLTPGQGANRWTNLLIIPGRAWTAIDGLLTNFHLPRSTLMALVASLLDHRSGPPGAGWGEGVARLKAIYAEAIAAGYRFYSYGDAMLVMP